MTIFAGDKLGPSEILAPIGAGGMGEVYRAKDTKLPIRGLDARRVQQGQTGIRFSNYRSAVFAMAGG
jgi:serine/threonine protein kinase